MNKNCISFSNILTLDRAVNQEMHLCKRAEEQRNRCIWSKISEYHLDLWTWLNSVCVRPQEAGGQLYYQVPQTAWDSQFEFELQLESVGDKLPEWEPAADRGLWAPSDQRLSSPAMMRKKCCYGQRNFGSICSSLSPSSTLLSHTRNINFFENKVWEVYFSKEECSFVHWRSSLCLIMFRMYYIFDTYSCITAIQYIFITSNLHLNRERASQRYQKCTLTGVKMQFFCETSLPFCFVLLG